MTKNLELRLRHKSPDTDECHYATVNAYGEVSCSGWQLPEYDGIELGTVGIIRDITARKEYELALEKALSAKEVLLKEIHHRVKNNLQVVSSLLNLQESFVEDLGARKVFLECQTQIQSMAMVHEVLYRSDNFEGVEMQTYFRRLVEYLFSVYEAEARNIRCSVDAPNVILDLDNAIPVALIVNELISNSCKHAFPDGRDGRVNITMAESAGNWELVVTDNGVGFEATTTSKKGMEPGLGTELIQALTAQIRGELKRGSGEGASIRITFPR
jgi:two-component sensor histidine kinase